MKKAVWTLFAVLFIGFSLSACSVGGNSSTDNSTSSIDVTSSSSDSETESSVNETQYTLTYHLGDFENDSIAYISSKTQKVSYGETLNLLVPTRSGYQFVCWKVQGQSTPYQDTTYNFQRDITLVAAWAEVLNGSSEWTENG